MEIIKIIGTSLLSVGVLFVIAKLLGHRQISQLDFFDYINGITIGSIAAELATDLETPWKSLIGLIIYGCVSAILGILTRKIHATRKLINGTPTIVMNDGKLYKNNLKKAKLDLSDFLVLCREQGYFDLNEIKTAVFEYNGRLSILPKGGYRPASPNDLRISVSDTQIGTELIMDGRILLDNLSRIGRDERWLTKQLKLLGHNNTNGIFLCIYRPDNDIMNVYPIA